MAQHHHADTNLFKLAVLAILILIFITVATIKIWELRAATERVGVMHTLGALQSALGIKLSEIVVREGASALVKLQHSNPMDLLQQGASDDTPYNIPAAITPANYLGEFIPAKAPAEEGVWYFDLEQKILIYRVRFIKYFHSDNETYPHLARYQLRIHYHDRNGNGRIAPKQATIASINIEAMDNYSWSIDPEQ